MKKVVVTRENYEEVMFNLLENEYETSVREDILSQIEADTFLAFEWNQWSKAHYSEGLEPYKSQEAEFIESLVREEKQKKLIPFFRKELYWAAASLVLISMTLVFYRYSDKSVASTQIAGKEPIPSTEHSDTTKPLQNAFRSSEGAQSVVAGRKPHKTEAPLIVANAVIQDSVKSPMAVNAVVRNAGTEDTLKMMIAKATSDRKKSRYKISITESEMDGSINQNYAFNEKRYTMADVLVHKDGITLSKFLNNSKSRIIKTENNTIIEYIAEDQSVLILTLAN